jgi:HPt (histidine-containing phosphotransfer) domain-containing protein
MTAMAVIGDKERCIDAGMDSYVSKPIKSEELFETIKRFVFVPEVENTPSSLTEKDKDVGDLEGVFDMAAVMSKIDGDEELLKELVAIFLENYPKQMSDIKDAIEQGSSKALEKSSHSLKGSVGIFCTKLVYDTALKLELMGRENNLANAGEVYTLLEREIAHLKLLLERDSKGA